MKHASHIQMETLFAFWFAIMVIGWGSMIRTFRYIPKSNIVSKNFLNFLTWMAARYIHGEIGSQQIALHYSVDSGIDFYGDIDKIYIIPLLGFFIILINFLLYFNIIIYKDRKFISYILFTTSLVCNLILLISIVSVYLINFR